MYGCVKKDTIMIKLKMWIDFFGENDYEIKTKTKKI